MIDKLNKYGSFKKQIDNSIGDKSRLAKNLLSCFYDRFVVEQTFRLIMSFRAKKLLLSQAPQRSLSIFICFAFIIACTPKTDTNKLSWDFPLPRTHTGVLLGNGTQGLMIWGADSQLNITIAHAGFWDHRGGRIFNASMHFTQVQKLLYANDDEGLKNLFKVSDENRFPSRSHQIGGGRLEYSLPNGFMLRHAELDLHKAEITIFCENLNGKKAKIIIRQSVKNEIAWIHFSNTIQGGDIRLIPSYNHKQVKVILDKNGVEPPHVWNNKNINGFTQSLPADDGLAIAYTFIDDHFLIASDLGKNPKKQVVQCIENLNIEAENTARNTWWKDYWLSVPEIKIPDTKLQEAYYYGLYKQACSNPPHAAACALQGPFMEEYQLPKWSNDYHFNINEQMIYLPSLATNRATHFMPLWKMIMQWYPQMILNGNTFYQTDSALLMPHAVDDRGNVVGIFWTGIIDQACSAWMAHLAWLNYRYTLDTSILRDIAWPLLKASFNGYYAMLEEVSDGKGGKRFSLPISISPEFKGKRMDAWGRDASFQLAALHMNIDDLIKAARVLSKPVDPRWVDVSQRLPAYTTIVGSRVKEYPEFKTKRIAFWEGMDLIESHRHHSHLASIYPFCTINPFDTTHFNIVSASIYQWSLQGMGTWTGWCLPWAATIHARFNQSDAAISKLHYWQNNFVNTGRGTLHNADMKGISTAESSNYDIASIEDCKEIMQLDAGFGVLDAIHNIILQQRDSVLYILPSIPRDWNNFSFKNICAEGAFRISATIKDRKIEFITIESLKGGELILNASINMKNIPSACIIENGNIHCILKKSEKITIENKKR